MSHPIRSAEVQEEVERKARVLESYSWGEMNVKFKLKDGRWSMSNVSVTFPRASD